MRNSAPVTIAPTGTISIIAGASSGIEPLFALSYVRNVMDQTRLMEVNPHFEAVAKDQGFYSEELMEQLARTGTLEDTDVPQWVKNVFRTSRDIDPSWHVRMQDAFQSHTDNAVSKTINFPATATRDDVRKAYMMAYESSCKGITIYRDGSKDQQVLSTGADGPETAPAPESRNGATQPQLPNMPVKRGTSDRPRQVWGVTERIRTGHGNMYVTINFDGDKQPFELFTNLGKAGGCDSAQLEAISRLASMALRSGVDVQEIIYNLRGITCCPAWDEGVQILSAPDAVAISLARHVEESEAGQPPRHDLPQGFRAQTPAATGRSLRQAPKCPDCSAPVEYQEGCESCTNPRCGWNRCN